MKVLCWHAKPRPFCEELQTTTFEFDVTVSSAVPAVVPPRTAKADEASRSVSATRESEPLPMSPLAPELVARMQRYWQAANYLTVGQIYLRENPLLREPLRAGHINCLLYTSDAADDLLCVDLGGRRI